MGRKKKLINNTNIPQYAIERFARCVFDDIRADFANEEIQKEFAIWRAEQAARKAELKLHKKARAASMNGSSRCLFQFLLSSRPSWLGFRAYLPTVGKISLLILCEINNKSEPIPNREKLVRIILVWCR